MPELKSGKGASWDDIAAGMEAGGSANFIFPKVGRTRVRLLWVGGDTFFLPVEAHVAGRTKTKYIILAFSQEDPTVIKGLVVPKSVLKIITGLCSEGLELFDSNEGFGIVIARTGSGLETSYTIYPSAKPVVLTKETIEAALKMDLKELAAQYNKNQTDRAANQGNRGAGGNQPPAEEDW